jgi:predicted transcriptional regulator
MAERDHITVLTTSMSVEDIVHVLREEKW